MVDYISAIERKRNQSKSFHRTALTLKAMRQKEQAKMRIPRPDKNAQISNLVPEGDHVAFVTEIDDKPSSSGSDMLTLTLQLRDKINGRKRTLKCWVPFSNAMRLQELYDSFPAAIDNEGFLNSDDLIGAICSIEVIHEMYNNKLTDKVDSLKRYKASEDDRHEDERGYEAEHQNKTQTIDDDCPF